MLRPLMRMTLDLDPVVLEELKRRAAREGKSLGRVASGLLAPALRREAPTRDALAWETGDLGAPLVDLEDDEALRRAVGS